jgi:hypothetical protein
VIETLLVLTAVATLCAASWVAIHVPPDALLYAGGVITGIGLVVGVPTGFWYHVALYRVLRPRGPLPERWWLHPVPLHVHLEQTDRRSVLPWFVVAGLGFFEVVIGCVVVVLGLAMFWLGSSG